MPLIHSPYRAPHIFKSAFISTVYSGIIRIERINHQIRERVLMTDGDFIDLDWMLAKERSRTLVVLLHGLGGDSKRPYIVGPAKLFNDHGIDTVGINFRGCSGENNRLYRTYHSGDTDDLNAIVIHILNTTSYENIVLHGVSLGGNVVLKYLGEQRERPKEVKLAVAVSAPCDLVGSVDELHKWHNFAFQLYFKWHLKARLRSKRLDFPDRISTSEIRAIKTLRDFDNVYTAPAHGFENGDHYYKTSSSVGLLSDIRVPVLLLNAKNDTFLTPSCTPMELGRHSSHLYVEQPRYGGHVGFQQSKSLYYDEERSVGFVKEMLGN